MPATWCWLAARPVMELEFHYQIIDHCWIRLHWLHLFRQYLTISHKCFQETVHPPIMQLFDNIGETLLLGDFDAKEGVHGRHLGEIYHYGQKTTRWVWSRQLTSETMPLVVIYDHLPSRSTCCWNPASRHKDAEIPLIAPSFEQRTSLVTDMGTIQLFSTHELALSLIKQNEGIQACPLRNYTLTSFCFIPAAVHLNAFSRPPNRCIENW